jgi:replicative DNA helicase
MIEQAPDQTSAGKAKARADQGGGSSVRRDWKRLSELIEQLPPSAVEAEMSLLGAMLIDPQVIGDVVMLIRNADAFYKPANGILYEAAVKLYDETSTLDVVQLHRKLVDAGTLEAIGGLGYLTELANAVPSAANAMRYAEIVKEKAAIRMLIEAAGEILYDAYHSNEKAQAVLEAAEQKIFEIAQQGETRQAEQLHILLDEAMRIIEESDGKPITGVPTGFTKLDEMTAGFQRGEMIIIAARPSMGKTALALNIAEQMAMRGFGVGVFSLEMGRQQLVQRLLASRSAVSSDRIRKGMLSKDDFRNLIKACDELHDVPIFIDDTPGLTLLQMRAKARRMKARHDIQAIVIDYLQLMSAGGRVESRQVEISSISRGVKAMARELNVTVMCLSQLNRSPEQREGHRPRMSDLRESGSIEQDADVVAMLHREDYYHQGQDDYAESNVAELILTKQRNGPTGTVELTWVPGITRFRDYAPVRDADSYYQPAEIHTVPAQRPQPPASAFAPGSKTGPVANHRDGGGPDADNLDSIDGIPV